MPQTCVGQVRPNTGSSSRGDNSYSSRQGQCASEVEVVGAPRDPPSNDQKGLLREGTNKVLPESGIDVSVQGNMEVVGAE